jgi:hypothetical protein
VCFFGMYSVHCFPDSSHSWSCMAKASNLPSYPSPVRTLQSVLQTSYITDFFLLRFLLPSCLSHWFCSPSCSDVKHLELMVFNKLPRIALLTLSELGVKSQKRSVL